MKPQRTRRFGFLSRFQLDAVPCARYHFWQVEHPTFRACSAQPSGRVVRNVCCLYRSWRLPSSTHPQCQTVLRQDGEEASRDGDGLYAKQPVRL